jgi:hypothetical protein
MRSSARRKGLLLELISPRLRTSALPSERLFDVDAINTFHVSAGHFAYFRVVSRSEIQRFCRSAQFWCLVRFPAAPLAAGIFIPC